MTIACFLISVLTYCIFQNVMAAMLKDHPQMQIYFSITFKTNYLLCVQCIYTAVLNERLNQLKGFIL